MQDMKRRIGLVLVGTLLLVAACKRGYSPEIPDANYPTDVNQIMLTKCATSNCHSRTSYQNAGGLLLDSWDHLFNGSNNGAAVVPYRPENSPLLYYINNGSFPELQRQHPAFSGTSAITNAEYTTIKNWIASGAPDKDGNIPFATNSALRQKLYVVHATPDNCRLLAVIDAERKVVMRYIPVNTAPAGSLPQHIKVSPDGKYAYMCLQGSPYLIRINATTDQVMDSLNIGSKQWSEISLSDDGKKLLLSAQQSDGVVLVVNTATMTIDKQLNGANQFINPHGIAGVAGFDTFYTASSAGNVVYKTSADGSFHHEISINGSTATHTSIPGVTPDPYDLVFNPDYTRLLISCTGTNEVRIFDARHDTLMRVIPVGAAPRFITISRTTDYAFVACMNDNNAAGSGYKGSVCVINYKTLDFVKKIEGPFADPGAVVVDDAHGIFYVLSQNTSGSFSGANGSVCGKPDGWYTMYDLKTFQALSGRIETTSNPFFADSRFK
jgi:DNA-binding beta-propeller fold protein YncE